MLQWIGAATAITGSVLGAQATNRAASQSQQDILDRWEWQAMIGKEQIQEQQQDVLEKTTDITRKFLTTKGKMTAAQAGMGVTGKTAQRMALMTRAEASELKSKVMKEAETNVVNIANNVMAKKLDADANITKLQSQKKSTAAIIFNAASAGMQGYSMGSNFAGTDFAKNFMPVMESGNIYAASGLKYGTTFGSEQSMMLAAQDF